MGQYLGDDAFSNAAMDSLLLTASSADVVDLIKRGNIKALLGYGKGVDVESSPWRWLADCVASGMQEENAQQLWERLNERPDFAMAVLKRLARNSAGKLEVPTIACRHLYLTSGVAEH